MFETWKTYVMQFDIRYETTIKKYNQSTNFHVYLADSCSQVKNCKHPFPFVLNFIYYRFWWILISHSNKTILKGSSRICYDTMWSMHFFYWQESWELWDPHKGEILDVWISSGAGLIIIMNGFANRYLVPLCTES